MINFENGQRATRNYEDIGVNFGQFVTSVKLYNKHLNDLATDTYKRFKQLKEDFDNKMINGGVYRDYLIVIKSYFDENKPPYHESLHHEEMLEEIKKIKLQ